MCMAIKYVNAGKISSAGLAQVMMKILDKFHNFICQHDTMIILFDLNRTNVRATEHMLVCVCVLAFASNIVSSEAFV